MRFGRIQTGAINEGQLVLDKVMFSGKAKILDFANQVDQELQRLLDKWGLDGYLREWREHPFPVEAHQRLRQNIAAYETNRSVNSRFPGAVKK